MNANSSELNKGGSRSTDKYTATDGIDVAHKSKQCKNGVRECQLIRTNDSHMV